MARQDGWSALFDGVQAVAPGPGLTSSPSLSATGTFPEDHAAAVLKKLLPAANLEEVDGSADSLEAGTLVEVETTSGSYRGTLTKAYDGSADVELRYAGHHLRLDRWCIQRVLACDPLDPRR